MGLSLKTAMKSSEVPDKKMSTDEMLLIQTVSEETKILPNFKETDIQTERNCKNKAITNGPTKVEGKNEKLFFKQCDKSNEDFNILSNQLQKFLKHVWKAQEFSHYLFDLPCQLQNKLEADAKELDTIYLQIKATSKNIETIKTQLKAIQSEKRELNNTLTKKTNEEKQEMEMIVSIYDKAMLNRWEAVKSSQTESVVENFLVDVEGKLQAMKHLQTLVTDKLLKLKNKTRREVAKENNLNKKDNKGKKNKCLKGEMKNFCGWEPAINSEHTSIASFVSSHTSIDSFSESQSDDALNTALNVDVNSVLEALFGEQLPLGSSAHHFIS